MDYSFYQRDAVTVAKELLGKSLVRKYDDKKIKVKIVDTEAYLGAEDKASHAYNNKKTKRTKTMFKKAGLAYVYLIYGMYYCLNVVNAAEGDPQAVLIRAVEPTAGLDLIRENRQINPKKREDLSNGPGKLSQALKIDKSLDSCNLVKSSKLYIVDDNNDEFQIETAKRVNIDYAEEYRDKKWRFYIKDNQYKSK